MAPRRRRRSSSPAWARLDTETLLDQRLCDLDLRIEDTALQARVDRLHAELERAGLRFRPHVWLSTDWFTPDGVIGFAVPFFLAHPRLARLEHAHMFEVEGGSHDQCMRLLRHETGHAIDNAYRLHWRKRWRETFGRFSEPYRDTYSPRPRSRNFVVNLDGWYAQSHPAEDWAESFAVWLRPRPAWRTEYAGWPALRKLAYVDEVMTEIATAPLKVRSRARPDALRTQRITLREYYAEKQARHALDTTTDLESYLQPLFSADRGHRGRPTAVAFLRRHRHELRTRVAAVTGQYRYVVDQALKEVAVACRRHRLRLTRPASETLLSTAILLTMLTMRFAGGRRREFSR